MARKKNSITLEEAAEKTLWIYEAYENERTEALHDQMHHVMAVLILLFNLDLGMDVVNAWEACKEHKAA